MSVVRIDLTQGCATVNPTEVFLTGDLDALAAVLEIPVEAMAFIRKVARPGDTLRDIYDKLNAMGLFFSQA